MGTATTEFAKDETMVLNKAILIYGDNRSAAFATIHSVSTDKSGADRKSVV